MYIGKSMPTDGLIICIMQRVMLHRTIAKKNTLCNRTHNIENIGEEDLYTIFWINEFYDSNDPDTYFENV